MSHHPSMLCAAMLAAALVVATSAAAQPVNPRQIKAIHIPADANAGETRAADLLQEKLQQYYELALDIVEGAPAAGAPAILVGRAAVQAGMIAPEELEAVKHDGYVLKAEGSRLAAAGYARQGTVYAAWALLWRLGLRLYPWASGADDGTAVVFEPVPGGLVAPFNVSDKPFFEHRDLRGHIDRGRWGGTLREYTLGDPSQAANQDLFGRDGQQRKPGYTKYTLDGGDWTDWFHTAAYLIPRDIYYETDSEYFAIHDGKRIPPSRYARSAICTSHPDVVRISTERFLEWVDIQRDRRIFCVVPADTGMCECDTCLAADPLPGQNTDRMLTWVNAVARAAKAKYPDKVILTAAYIGTVNPPVREKPESNVVVMYCPWFWDSRATSDVSLDSPLNVTAMKEFMAWVMRFPGQVGAYDYPVACVWGTAERVKLYARHGVRMIYFNGPQGDLLQWINSQLLWDPFQDTEKLQDEYVQAFYGPAAEPMGDYLRLRRAAIEEHAEHGRPVFYQRGGLPGAVGSEYARAAKSSLGRAVALAEGADLKTQARVLGDVLAGLRELLGVTHPVTGNPGARSSADVYKDDLQQYVALSQLYVRKCEELELRFVARQYRTAFQDAMSGLGITLPEADEKDLFDKTLAALGELLAQSLAAEPPTTQPDPKTVTVRFDGPHEDAKWLSDGTQARLVQPPTMVSIGMPEEDDMGGVGIDARLSRLPTIPKGNITIHAGRFYAERVFDEPLDVTGCFFLDLHLLASHDVPVTIYVDNLHSDFHLHAGEQIVRIDLRNFGTDERFDWRKWSKLERIGIDIWPQDNYYPFPQVHDTDVTLISLTVGNQLPTPERLPHRGKAIWLSQFRSNVPHGVAVPRERYDELMQRQQYKHVGLDYGSKHLHEGFRTFTEHRAVSPIYGIVTSVNAEPAELEAARELQRLLAKGAGVTLPVQPLRPPARPDANVIVLGEAARAARRVTDMELAYVGPEGFVINAHNGGIAIAGPDAAGTAHGVARYLEDHGVRFYRPEAPHTRPLRRGMLHELYTLERPFFKQRPVTGGWQLKAQGPAGRESPAGRPDAAAVGKLAEAIKDAARRGEDSVPRSVIADAERSALSRYVAAKLLWDPFADATRMVREFPAG